MAATLFLGGDTDSWRSCHCYVLDIVISFEILFLDEAAGKQYTLPRSTLDGKKK